MRGIQRSAILRVLGVKWLSNRAKIQLWQISFNSLLIYCLYML